MGPCNLLTAVAGHNIKDPVILEALAYESHYYTTNLANEWSDWRLGITDRNWFRSSYDHYVGDFGERNIFNHSILMVVQIRDLGANVIEDDSIPSATYLDGKGYTP